MNDAKIVLGLMCVYGLLFIGWWIGKTTSTEPNSVKGQVANIIAHLVTLLMLIAWANSLFNLIYHNINTHP